jgi:hypothetical protein
MDIPVLLLLVGSIYLAGLIARYRGRSFKNWAWIGAIIGPLALPLVFLFPDLRRREGDQFLGPPEAKVPDAPRRDP